jgi:predicted DCC family thiol-disulfide oxidoreductase YuxK
MDRKNKFQFASLQSESGKKLLLAHHLPPDALESIYLVQNDRFFEKSEAIVHIFRQLSWVWPLAWLIRILPLNWRNRVYMLIATNRYELFGKKDRCIIPSKEIYDKFII